MVLRDSTMGAFGLIGYPVRWMVGVGVAHGAGRMGGVGVQGQDFFGVLPYMPMLVRPRKWTQ